MLKTAYSFLIHRLIPDNLYIKYKFKKTFGYNLNLKNPETFNEKLQWKKFFDRKKIYTTCSDKYEVRKYIKNIIGEQHLIPLLQTAKNPKNINFDILPKQFVIKPNFSSGEIIIINDKNKIDRKEIINKCKKWLKTNYFYLGKEWQYKNIAKKIIIEKLIVDKSGGIPIDYRFHCFNGNIEFIQADKQVKYVAGSKNNFKKYKRGHFDKGWQPLPFVFCPKKNNQPAYETCDKFKKPKCLIDMIRIAESLSAPFNYVRVDLYNPEEIIYFGELTFCHGAGFQCFFPPAYDKLYGEKINLEYEKP